MTLAIIYSSEVMNYKKPVMRRAPAVIQKTSVLNPIKTTGKLRSLLVINHRLNLK